MHEGPFVDSSCTQASQLHYSLDTLRRLKQESIYSTCHAFIQNTSVCQQTPFWKSCIRKACKPLEATQLGLRCEAHLVMGEATRPAMQAARKRDDVNICRPASLYVHHLSAWPLSVWLATLGKNSFRKSSMEVTPPVMPTSYPAVTPVHYNTAGLMYRHADGDMHKQSLATARSTSSTRQRMCIVPGSSSQLSKLLLW